MRFVYEAVFLNLPFGKGANVMVHHKHSILAGRLLPIVLLSLLVIGCSENDSISGPTDGSELGEDPGVLVEDPFEGALNSTLGFTPPDPGDRIDRLAEFLGLDEDQKEAMAAAYAEFRDGIDALRDQVISGELTRDEAHELSAALRESFEAELQVILTAEQYELLQELRDGRGGLGDGPGHKPGDPGRGDGDPHALWMSWLTEIGADSSQKEAIIEALEALHEGLMDIRTQVKDGSLTRDEARDAAQELRAAFDELLQSTLTEEQYDALGELRPDCRGRRN